jgi:hypothetical protein
MSTVNGHIVHTDCKSDWIRLVRWDRREHIPPSRLFYTTFESSECGLRARSVIDIDPR